MAFIQSVPSSRPPTATDYLHAGPAPLLPRRLIPHLASASAASPPPPKSRAPPPPRLDASPSPDASRPFPDLLRRSLTSSPRLPLPPALALAPRRLPSSSCAQPTAASSLPAHPRETSSPFSASLCHSGRRGVCFRREQALRRSENRSSSDGPQFTPAHGIWVLGVVLNPSSAIHSLSGSARRDLCSEAWVTLRRTSRRLRRQTIFLALHQFQ